MAEQTLNPWSVGFTAATMAALSMTGSVMCWATAPPARAWRNRRFFIANRHWEERRQRVWMDLSQDFFGQTSSAGRRGGRLVIYYFLFPRLVQGWPPAHWPGNSTRATVNCVVGF